MIRHLYTYEVITSMNLVSIWHHAPTQSHQMIFAERPKGKESHGDFCRLTVPYDQEEVGLLLYDRGKEE